MPIRRKVTKKKATKKRAVRKVAKKRAVRKTNGDVMRVIESGGKTKTIRGKENQQAYLDKREKDGACEAQEMIARANQFLLKANFALQKLVMSDLPTRFDYDDLSMTIADHRFALSEEAFDVLERRCNSLGRSKRATVRRRK